MINFSKLFYLKFWFNAYPGAMSKPFLLFFIVMTIVFSLLAIVSYFFNKKRSIYQKTWNSFFQLCFFSVVYNIFWIFFVWQTIPVLSSRFWFAIWLLIIIIWFVFIFRQIFIKIPQRKKILEQKNKIKKYLP